MLHNLNEREARARDARIQAEPPPEEISPLTLEEILSGKAPEDEPEPKDIEEYDPAYLLELVTKCSACVNETIELWKRGVISRAEMAAHILPLLRSQRAILLALQVAKRKRGLAVKH